MPKPVKPPLIIRSYNKISNLTGGPGELNMDRIIKKSRKNTGSNDLGADFNDEALSTLIDSINKEAKLNPFGQLMIKEKLIGQLESRLWATHWFKKHPEILEQEVLPIILITGLQRTGTTKMQRLLSELPGSRSLMSWEALYPAPIKTTGESKKRISRTRRNEKAVQWISPTFQSIHPIFHDRPEEDVLLLDVHFMSSSSEAILNVPSYAEWLNKQDQTEAYAYEKKLLQLLQWQLEGEYWVLKSPHHLEYLDTFNQVFPDTQVVWMHRNPIDCVPSFMSMLYYGRSMFSDDVDPEVIKSQWLKKLSIMLKAGLQYRRQNGAIIDVLYENFMKDEHAVLKRLAQLPAINIKEESLPVDDRFKDPYVSKHKYLLSDWGLSEDDISNLFSAYEALVTSLKNSN